MGRIGQRVRCRRLAYNPSSPDIHRLTVPHRHREYLHDQRAADSYCYCDTSRALAVSDIAGASTATTFPHPAFSGHGTMSTLRGVSARVEGGRQCPGRLSLPVRLSSAATTE